MIDVAWPRVVLERVGAAQLGGLEAPQQSLVLAALDEWIAANLLERRASEGPRAVEEILVRLPLKAVSLVVVDDGGDRIVSVGP